MYRAHDAYISRLTTIRTDPGPPLRARLEFHHRLPNTIPPGMIQTLRDGSPTVITSLITPARSNACVGQRLTILCGQLFSWSPGTATCFPVPPAVVRSDARDFLPRGTGIRVRACGPSHTALASSSYAVHLRRPAVMVENELAIAGWHATTNRAHVIDGGIPLRTWRLSRQLHIHRAISTARPHTPRVGSRSRCYRLAGSGGHCLPGQATLARHTAARPVASI